MEVFCYRDINNSARVSSGVEPDTYLNVKLQNEGRTCV